MHAADASTSDARHELALVATLLVGLTAAVDPGDAFIIAGLTPLAILLAGLGVLGTGGASERPYTSLLLPATLTGAAAAAVHLVPSDLGLLAALAALAIVLDRVLALEMGILAQPSGVSDGDRARVLGAAVLTAFVVFTGVAALVPGGMPEPAGSPTAGSSAMTEGWLAVLVLEDTLAALVIGWRISALRFSQPMEIARSASTYALVVAVVAGLIRAIDLPRLVGPAVLTLVFYLWDAQHGSAPARRRERRFLWELALLAALAIVVVVWNLRLRQ